MVELPLSAFSGRGQNQGEKSGWLRQDLNQLFLLMCKITFVPAGVPSSAIRSSKIMGVRFLSSLKSVNRLVVMAMALD